MVLESTLRNLPLLKVAQELIVQLYYEEIDLMSFYIQMELSTSIKSINIAMSSLGHLSLSFLSSVFDPMTHLWLLFHSVLSFLHSMSKYGVDFFIAWWGNDGINLSSSNY